MTHRFFTHREEWIEIAESRDANHAFWKHSDGRVMIENSKKPIHFLKNNNWERIDARCVRNEGGWTASQQDHPVRVCDNASFSTGFASDEELTLGNRSFINNDELSFKCAESGINAFTAGTQFPWITKELVAYENAVKYSYLLRQAPDAAREYTVFSETIEFKKEVSIVTHDHEGRMENSVWLGPIHFVDRRNSSLGTMLPALCFDAQETWERESQRITAGYTWSIEGTTITISLHVPNSWLRSEERVYPVTIDPLVVGPTSAFGDNVMLSCFIPQYNVDSLWVTIPSQVTVTGCFVTASFWADPLAGAVMMDGSMFFSTNCDSSETFEVQPPTGLQAGTAYLELFDFRDPLLCCFNPSCNEQSFYFRMHLGRYTPEGDCNYSYIFYNPTTTFWPFTAYIEGRTVETYGLEFTVPGTPICSNQCTFEGKVRTKYGVPPYTISHPWLSADSIVSVASACDLSGTITDLFMQWPGCPEFCPEPFSIDVPAPIITDACGNVVTGLVAETLNLKASPSISDPSPVQVCSDIQEDIFVQSCAPDFTLTWSGNGSEGSGYNIPVLASNSADSIAILEYNVNAVWNGCPSDTLNLIVEVMPSPNAAFEIAPNPGMQGVPTFFVDQSTVSSGSVVSWNWTLDGEQQQSGDINSYIISDLGFHTVCLEVLSDAGCPDTLCKEFEVVTPTLDAPNVFTPNGDGTNPVLVFDQLQYYPSSYLYVYNRWGNLVYEKENYQNNWDGGDLPEGVYYYVLNIEFYGSIASYLHILR
ncbi:MAG: gliding motility-associated C-terminal domain-containing protein [Flavobacteriales bacterium]